MKMEKEKYHASCNKRKYHVTMLLLSSFMVATALPDRDIETFFTDLDAKGTPLYRCTGGNDGIKWRLPRPTECHIPSEAPSATTTVGVTVVFPDITEQTIKGYECTGVNRTQSTWKSVLGAYWESEVDTTYFPISPEKCWKMITTHHVEDDSYGSNRIYKIDRLQSGLLGTKNILETYYKWLSPRTFYAANYYIRSLSIGVFELDQSIQTTAVLEETCQYNRTFCKTAEGILVWKIDNIKTCRFKEGQSSYCLFSIGDHESRLSCPELEISLTNVSVIEACSGYIGSSEQGLYFTQIQNKTIHDDIMTTEEFRQIATKPMSRARRAANRKFTNGLDARLNAKFQYFFQYWIKYTTFDITKVHYEMCKVTQAQMRMIRHTASTGNPSVIPNVLLGEGSYKAQLNGDVLSIWKCHEVYEYMFLRREECTYEWPVKYMQGHEAHLGYVTPLSHNIVDTPTSLKSVCREFYFDTGDYTILLSNMSYISNLPVLPRPGAFEASDVRKPKLSVRSTGTFDVIRDGNPEGTYELLREVRSSTALNRAIYDKAGIVKDDTTNATDVLDRVIDMAITPIVTSTVFSYFTGAICIIFGLWLLNISIKSGCLPDAISFMLDQIKELGSHISSLMSRTVDRFSRRENRSSNTTEEAGMQLANMYPSLPNTEPTAPPMSLVTEINEVAPPRPPKH